MPEGRLDIGHSVAVPQHSVHPTLVCRVLALSYEVKTSKGAAINKMSTSEHTSHKAVKRSHDS